MWVVFIAAMIVIAVAAALVAWLVNKIVLQIRRDNQRFEESKEENRTDLNGLGEAMRNFEKTCADAQKAFEDFKNTNEEPEEK